MPGEVDDDGDRRRVVGAVAVDVRPEAPAQAREAGHLPEVREELLELLVDEATSRRFVHGGFRVPPDRVVDTLI